LALTEKANVLQIAQKVGNARRPSVIWLHFQDCTGCSETLLRTSAPDVAHLILDVISLDYHETLMAASGAQADAALKQAIQQNAGTGEQAGAAGAEGSVVASGGRGRDWFVRVMGWSAFGGSESNGRGGNGFCGEWETGGQPPRLPAKSL
jgi:hypothetical protein